MTPHKAIQKQIRHEVEDEVVKLRAALPVYDDMDDLIGTWSPEQAREFLEATADFGRVDEALWR